LQLQDGEERDFRKTVLWLRDARSTQPAVRVEVVGLADARGPLGSAIVTNMASVAAWPAPDHGEYYLSVAPGANARELAAGVSLAGPDLKANTIGDELRLVQGVRGRVSGWRSACSWRRTPWRVSAALIPSCGSQCRGISSRSSLASRSRRR